MRGRRLVRMAMVKGSGIEARVGGENEKQRRSVDSRELAGGLGLLGGEAWWTMLVWLVAR